MGFVSIFAFYSELSELDLQVCNARLVKVKEVDQCY